MRVTSLFINSALDAYKSHVKGEFSTSFPKTLFFVYFLFSLMYFPFLHYYSYLSPFQPRQSVKRHLGIQKLC